MTQLVESLAGNVLFVSAHPDDEAMAYSSTVAALTKQSPDNVYVLTATLGETSTLGDQSTVKSGGRLAEVEKAYDALGVRSNNRFYPKLPDGELHLTSNIEKLAEEIIEIVKVNNISTLVTPGQNGFDQHSDHVAVHEAAMFAASTLRDTTPLTVWGIDVNSGLSMKVEEANKRSVVAIHASQFPDKQAIDSALKKEPVYQQLMKRESYSKYPIKKGYEPRGLNRHTP